MNLSFYPTEWPTIARYIKEACAWRCAVCDRQCRRPGEFYLGWEYELALAHITQDYLAPAVQVACLCGSCHLRHDAPLGWVARRRADRWRARQAGQLKLLANISI